MNNLFKVSTAIFFLWVYPLAALLSPDMGTLVVHYQMQEGEKLDRVHFWLINEKKERTLYPKKEEIVANSHAPNERTVVITHIPAGRYQIVFLIPNSDKQYEEIAPKTIYLAPGEVLKIDQAIKPRLSLNQNDPQDLALIVRNYYPPYYPSPYYPIPGSTPAPVTPASISLISNQPQASWRLVRKGRLIYSGVGSVSNFKVPPGQDYNILAEDIEGYTFITSPKAPFDLAPGQILKLELFYQRNVGYIMLTGEVPPQVQNLGITLYPEDENLPPIPATVTPSLGKIIWESGPLLTGKYILSINSPSLSFPNQTFTIERGGRTQLFLPKLLQKANLLLSADSSQAIFTLENKEGAIIGQGQGFTYTFQNLTPGNYVVKFSSSDPSLIPANPSQEILIGNQNVQLKINYKKKMEKKEPPKITSSKQEKPALISTAAPVQETIFAHVPSGIAIIGDPFTDNPQNERPPHEENISVFDISIYPVTNGQYAEWLDQALKAKKVVAGDAQRPGYFLSPEGEILCKTFDANPNSQLTVQQNGKEIYVLPIPGKENYPVIEVTWKGAMAYCHDKGYRLPTESEWEKAGGMSLPKDNQIGTRYKYGFGQNTIDRTWANYREKETPSSGQVLTTPVGFYNGVNTLPLTTQDRTAKQTHDAKSPIGAYDMSGNVWEWVADRQGESNIAKGGCFDSLAEGVRVSERLLLPQNHSDIFTGFRVAK